MEKAFREGVAHRPRVCETQDPALPNDSPVTTLSVRLLTVPLADMVHIRLSNYPMMASASISTSMSGSIKRFTSTMVVAGLIDPNTSPCARPTSCH